MPSLELGDAKKKKMAKEQKNRKVREEMHATEPRCVTTSRNVGMAVHGVSPRVYRVAPDRE